MHASFVFVRFTRGGASFRADTRPIGSACTFCRRNGCTARERRRRDREADIIADVKTFASRNATMSSSRDCPRGKAALAFSPRLPSLISQPVVASRRPTIRRASMREEAQTQNFFQLFRIAQFRSSYDERAC